MAGLTGRVSGAVPLSVADHVAGLCGRGGAQRLPLQGPPRNEPFDGCRHRNGRLSGARNSEADVIVSAEKHATKRGHDITPMASRQTVGARAAGGAGAGGAAWGGARAVLQLPHHQQQRPAAAASVVPGGDGRLLLPRLVGELRLRKRRHAPRYEAQSAAGLVEVEGGDGACPPDEFRVHGPRADDPAPRALFPVQRRRGRGRFSADRRPPALPGPGPERRASAVQPLHGLRAAVPAGGRHAGHVLPVGHRLPSLHAAPGLRRPRAARGPGRHGSHPRLHARQPPALVRREPGLSQPQPRRPRHHPVAAAGRGRLAVNPHHQHAHLVSPGGEDGQNGEVSACWRGQCSLERSVFAGEVSVCWRGQCLLERSVLAGEVRACRRVQCLLEMSVFAGEVRSCWRGERLLERSMLAGVDSACWKGQCLLER